MQKEQRSQRGTTNQAKFENANPVQRGLLSRFQRAFLAQLRSVQPQSVLEAGAGEGFLLSAIQKAFPVIPLLGVEVSGTALAEGKRLFPSLPLERGDIYHLVQKEKSWDVVVCSEVLEHLTDPSAALGELQRVARRYILLSVPNEPWFRLGNFARGRHLRRLGNTPEHINLWSKNGFARFVAQQLSIVTVTSSFPWTIVLAKA